MPDELDGVEVYCPVCDEKTILTEDDFRASLRHKKDTGGVLLNYCKKWGHVFELPEMPTKGSELKAWIVKAQEDPDNCCPCIPLLDGRQGDDPAGSTLINGVMHYTVGDISTPPLNKWAYMAAHAINPEIALANNPDMGGEPVVLGKPAKKAVKE